MRRLICERDRDCVQLARSHLLDNLEQYVSRKDAQADPQSNPRLSGGGAIGKKSADGTILLTQIGESTPLMCIRLHRNAMPSSCR